MPATLPAWMADHCHRVRRGRTRRHSGRYGTRPPSHDSGSPGSQQPLSTKSGTPPGMQGGGMAIKEAALSGFSPQVAVRAHSRHSSTHKQKQDSGPPSSQWSRFRSNASSSIRTQSRRKSPKRISQHPTILLSQRSPPGRPLLGQPHLQISAHARSARARSSSSGPASRTRPRSCGMPASAGRARSKGAASDRTTSPGRVPSGVGDRSVGRSGMSGTGRASA